MMINVNYWTEMMDYKDSIKYNNNKLIIPY